MLVARAVTHYISIGAAMPIGVQYYNGSYVMASAKAFDMMLHVLHICKGHTWAKFAKLDYLSLHLFHNYYTCTAQ